MDDNFNKGQRKFSASLMQKLKGVYMGYNILQKGVCHIPDNTKKILVKVEMKTDITIDFVCYMINKSKKVSDTICYQNLLGHGIKMDENNTELHINFDNIESNIHWMMLCLCVYAPQKEYKTLGIKGETMFNVQNIVIRIYDEDTKKEICHFVLTNQEKTTAVYIGNIEKTYSGWSFKAIEENLNGDIIGVKNIVTNSRHLSKLI